MKYYRMSYDEVVNRRSYTNIILLNSAIPSYGGGKDKKGDGKGEKPKEVRHANQIFDQLM